MANKVATLSKSKIMEGLQCPKQLWLSLNRKDLIAPTDLVTQAGFDEGNEVGAKARENFGSGVLIEAKPWEYEPSVAATNEAMKNGATTIYEAAFQFENFYARVDILAKGKKGWDLIEVKKSTSVKDYHYPDATVQAWIAQSAGLKINSVQIMYLNNECVFPGLEDLFTVSDITEQVFAAFPEIEKQVAQLNKVVAAKNEPKVNIGAHCDSPFACKFKEHCWKAVPEHSVFDLPTLKTAEKWELFESGQIAIKDLNPKDFSDRVQRAIEVTQSGKTYVDKKGIQAELKNWKWPLYFFDFETLGSAIPRYEGASPYTVVPFQFSCHVLRAPDAELEHFEYLHQGVNDPRPAVIDEMLKGLGEEGSIVAYYQSFEIRAIKLLAAFDKKRAKKLLALVDRFVDPLPVVRENVYHPEFRGSFSIKDVAPALLKGSASYAHLEIQDGSMAQVAAEALLQGKVDDSKRDQVIADLLNYCRMDTLAMVELVKWLWKAK